MSVRVELFQPPPIPVAQQEVVVMSCDLCRREIRVIRRTANDGDWGIGYEIDRFIIMREYGDPGPGKHNLIQYHCCPECWDSKIVALFAAAGSMTVVTEVSW